MSEGAEETFFSCTHSHRPCSNLPRSQVKPRYNKRLMDLHLCLKNKEKSKQFNFKSLKQNPKGSHSYKQAHL